MHTCISKRLVVAACVAASLLFLLPLQTGWAADTQPKLPPIVTVDGQPTSLNGRLVIRLDGPLTTDQAGKAKLFLKDIEIKDLKPELTVDGQGLVFPLRMTANNKAAWGSLLGSPGAFNIQLPLAVSVDDKLLGWKDDKAAKDVAFVVYNLWLMLGAAVIVAAAIWFVLRMARYTTILRDTLVAQIRISDRPFSLARSQMAWWFVLILTSFALVYVITGSTEAISAQALVLLGITSATTLGSSLIDQSRNGQAKTLEPKLVAAGFSSCADVEQAVKTALGDFQGPLTWEILNAAVTALAAKIAALPSPAGPLPPALQAESDAIAKLRGYLNLIADYRSESWWTDVVNDLNGPTVHRLQVVVWTAALGLIYVLETYHSLQVPVFSDNLLTLMGISSGVYLGLKIPEKQ